ncbi:MAG: pyridoxal phosphate-dependent aminotransferase [Acidobacteria bacterium]|nr:pyridoxal phosphate-dependent aminotransferase [Acidobacteriota bacterium]
MSRRFARRTEGMVQSDIRRMTRECERVSGINLGQGVCDQPTDRIIKSAAIHAIENDRSTYSKFEGIDLLRRRIAAKEADYNRVPCDPDTQVVVTVGSTGGFAVACLALLEPGDEVVVFSPFYSYHVNILKMCGAKAVFVPLTAPQWDFDPSALQAAFTPRTRMVIVNTPCNPCGKVFSAGELSAIGELCRSHGAIALTDEIYEYILFDDRVHVSLASLPGMADHTITLSGFSKTYSMTGWRLGYAIAPADIASRMGVLNDLLYICAPTPLQHGVAAAFDLPASYFEEMRSSYTRKRQMLVGACSAAGLKPYVPQGAYYFLADVSAHGFRDDREAAAALLARAGVATVPGSSFYADPEQGRQQVRLCFAKQMPELEEACRRLERFGA